MSLYSALYAGVSGLSAEAAAMAGVADNITNINTVGYKGTDTQFRTMVTDGKARSTYSAGGVQAAPRSLISQQGLLSASTSATDLAIDGNGMFVTRDGSGADSAVSFTRAGSFTADKQGYLRNTGGYYLQGWKLDNAGNYTNTGDLNALEPVRLSDLTGTAAPTSKVAMRVNLQSTQEAYTGAYAAGDMAKGTLAPQFTRAVTVYDAQGGSHQLNIGFTKRGANEWATEIYASPASDVSAANGMVAGGTVRFNGDGSLDLAGSSKDLFGSLNIGWTNGAGSSPIKLQLGDDKGLNGLTQFGSESALISSSVDGGLQGAFTVQVSESGRVSALFEDGTSREVFQLPIATFPNPDGLTRLSGNAYAASDLSGLVAINEGGAAGAGKLSSNNLEASTVDLAGEFTNMIRFQRAYSASSKIITTVDDMLQEVSNLKR
ncbi:flagellar hook protein FlgE [Sphingomonas sp. ac-8]|uniref:flagellar hook protein FlgE n=1 Tax=Sphingomonas sp. ac-8 TaxID=3242977 RepID=UPI003A80F503